MYYREICVYIRIVKEGTYATDLDNVVTFFIVLDDFVCTEISIQQAYHLHLLHHH